ncbi:MAG TPA: DNA polymerase I [Gemmatimonadaceae bacterium]|jgi:DNA polymerase-1|nr:DNA polymerase I [Gemmatimonadaceae bacterium]
MELPASPRLFLIDGYALIYRAFFALISRPLTTSRGENTSAAWGISNFLQRLLANHRPEYLGWVHDSGLSFRHERYPAYKATREKLTEELQSDFDTGMERVCALLEAYHIPILSLKGFEADDVIGTLVRQSVEHKLNVVVVSGDKDFQQLVQPGVWLLNPGRGGPASVEEHWVGVENASERLGVAPEYVTDYLALVGDSSDNVPGVKGIGEKTACELIAQYGHVEDILMHAEEIPKKRPREALLEHSENARLSKELVTIRTDLPVTLDLESLKISEPNADALRRLYLELEFHGLAKETTATSFEEPAPKETTNYTTVDTLAKLKTFMTKAKKAKVIAFDTETDIEPDAPTKVDPLRATLISVSIALAPGEAYYFPFAHTAPAPSQGDLLDDKKASKPETTVIRNLPPLMSPELKPFRDWLEDATVKKTAQNAKYDILVLRRAGVMVRGLDFDTMIASYIIDPGRRSHALDMLALELLDHPMIAYADVCGKGKTQILFSQVPVDAARDYSCEDADMTLRLRGFFERQLAAQQLTRLFDEIELPLVCVLAEMEYTGIAVDAPRFHMLKERFQREREKVQQEIYKVAGQEFNISSNVQLRKILFVKLGLPVIKRTSTGPSTDASVLQELAEEGHVLPSLLMEYRELAKLESTYLDTLPVLINPSSGRLHTSFNQTVASTGRLSSTDPNLQNIPIRRELGREIRRGFIPRKGWKLLAADYSQIELRLLAHLSHDPKFVEAFQTGGDIHRQTAAIIFDVPLKQVTPEMRGRAKTINFATIYGQGPHALSRQLGISHAEARDFIAKYFERFEGVKQYLDSMVEFAREHGYVQTIFGRRRYIPELRDRNFNIRAFGERTAANSPIQGSAADLIKIAMIRIDEAFRQQGVDSKMLLQVHDELVFEVPPQELEVIQGIVTQQMEHAAELSVPLVVDLGVGDNWLETKL